MGWAHSLDLAPFVTVFSLQLTTGRNDELSEPLGVALMIYSGRERDFKDKRSSGI